MRICTISFSKKFVKVEANFRLTANSMNLNVYSILCSIKFLAFSKEFLILNHKCQYRVTSRFLKFSLFSDKNSPCCQHCQYMRAGAKCREAQYATCEQESLCTGHQAECPKSPPMADNTDCQERGKCKDGKCIPYCETQGLQSCMCDISEF